MGYAQQAALLASALALCGCIPTKLGTLEQRSPTIQVQSAHSVAELSGCISGKLKSFRGSVSYVPRPDGATVTYEMAGVPFMSVSIADQGATRQVTTFGPYSLNKKVNRHRLDAVRTCI